jgi:hypothetical protein
MKKEKEREAYEVQRVLSFGRRAFLVAGVVAFWRPRRCCRQIFSLFHILSYFLLYAVLLLPIPFSAAFSFKKSIVFLVVMTFSLVDVYGCFGETYCLHLQDQKGSQNQQAAEKGDKSEDGGNMFLRTVSEFVPNGTASRARR